MSKTSIKFVKKDAECKPGNDYVEIFVNNEYIGAPGIKLLTEMLQDQEVVSFTINPNPNKGETFEVKG